VDQALQVLVDRLRAFLSGATSSNEVDALEGAFAGVLDNDERYVDLQHALAMYRGPHHPQDVDALRRECEWVLDALTKAQR
jgi:hypothetical protein